MVPLALIGATPAAAQASDDAIIAVALPDAQFRGFLMGIVAGTDTFKRSFFALGPTDGCAAFRPAFRAAYDKHLPQWRSNLVSAWRENIPAELLEKAVEAGPGSAGELVAPHQDAIGAAMEAASKPVLTEATAEVLAALYETAKDVDFTAIDRDTRLAELKALDTRNFCGVLSGNAATPLSEPSDDGDDRPGPELGE